MRARLWGPSAPLVLALSAIVYGTDQTHKWWMIDVYGIAERSPVQVTPFLDLVLVWNRGISYGLFSTHTQDVLVALSFVICLVLWVWACTATRPLGAAALALVIGGALGNATDRLFRGAVADFFYFHYQHFSWYVFNLADVAIVAGVAVLLYEALWLGQTLDRRGKA
ncbi:signal peptidase II [Aestuariivirga sp.]|jgi:signal peptidase II|uniref:signal peptidase II n=1 Tax=Aestuariivirga sp. TaxID=2650926 RepID=UPI0037836835